MQVIKNYIGILFLVFYEGFLLYIQVGDIVELLRGDVYSLFWQVLFKLQILDLMGDLLLFKE